MEMTQTRILGGNAIISAITLAFVAFGSGEVRADEGNCCVYAVPGGGTATGCLAFMGTGEGEGCNGTPYCCIPATDCHPLYPKKCDVATAGTEHTCGWSNDPACDPT
jgi:hypothetical protein